MLASLETPLLREDTATVVAITVSQLLMQTGEPLFPLRYLRLGTRNFPRHSPLQAPRDLPGGSLSHTHTHRDRPGAGSIPPRPAAR